ncbi:MAG: phage tail protein [Thiohalomonadaceae bacterium]
MDVNSTPYFLLRSAGEFEHDAAELCWNTALEALTLAQNQSLRLPASDPAGALSAWQTATPLALDSFNQMARLSGDRTTVEFNSGRGFLTLQDDALADVAAPLGAFADMALGGDGRLALPFTDGTNQHGLLVFHLVRRWQTHCDLSADPAGDPLPPPRRGWVDGENRIWIVTANHLLLCEGEPLPLPYEPQPARFEPEILNPGALRLRWAQSLPEGWEALAVCGDDASIYVLVHDGNGAQAIVTRPRDPRADSALRLHACAGDLPFVIDLALAADASYPMPGRLAALAPKELGDSALQKRDAVILELRWDSAGSAGTAHLVHERYPMLSLAVPRFVSSADGQLRYQAEEDPDYPGFVPRPRELHALRRPEYHLEGSGTLATILDSGQPDTHWHRLYLDATIPPGCAVEIGVKLCAGSDPGDCTEAEVIPQPSPVWNPLPSELGFSRSLAEWKPGVGGLFELLLQRPKGAVRRLTGRCLQLRITLRGNGSQTPCVHAIRVYYPRFSYQEAYLPELYRQEAESDPGDAAAAANGADVRERLLAAFEGVLTPIEGRIAASDELVHPDAAPAGHLPWLADALGTTLPLHWPEARRRRLVREATLVQQFKGTLYGVSLALDIASDGGVQRGEIVLVENFRLRRTMATLLGIAMDDAEHPLTLGTGMSGNSIVGDSLILSESDARQFLALFSPELATLEEAAQVKQFFDEYAHKITVLLHGRGARLRTVVEEVLAAQLPAWLQWRIFETEHPFVLGNAPLLAVDTFIETTPEFRRVTLNDTYLGREGVLKNPAAFSPADVNTLAPAL